MHEALAAALPEGAKREQYRAAHGVADAALDLRVSPRYWPAAQVFLLLGGQWRREYINAGDRIVTQWIGLDFSAAAGPIAALALPAHEQLELYEDLRIMESAALEVLNAR